MLFLSIDANFKLRLKDRGILNDVRPRIWVVVLRRIEEILVYYVIVW